MVANISPATPLMAAGSWLFSTCCSTALSCAMALLPLGGGMLECPGVAEMLRRSDR